MQFRKGWRTLSSFSARSTMVAAVAVSMVGAVAHATPITFSGALGDLAADAKFETSGSDLIVTLTNTSAADVLVPADILTTLFFDIVGPTLPLTRTSALIGPSSNVVFGPQPAGDVVGGEWAFETSIIGAPGGQDYGIGSAGFGIFGSSNRFPGPNLQGPMGVNGLQYGLTSAGDNTATGNSPVTGSNHFVQNAVVFTLSGLPSGFDPSASIANVSFQYGTSLTEPTITIPEPAALALMALGAITTLRRRHN